MRRPYETTKLKLNGIGLANRKLALNQRSARVRGARSCFTIITEGGARVASCAWKALQTLITWSGEKNRLLRLVFAIVQFDWWMTLSSTASNKHDVMTHDDALLA